MRSSSLSRSAFIVCSIPAMRPLQLFRRVLIREWQPQGDAVFRPDGFRDMPLARQIFGELDVTRTDFDFLAAGHLYLAAAAERDDVLPLRRDVPVERRANRIAVNLGARDLHQRRDVTSGHACERR